MCGITAKASKTLSRMIGGIDLHTTDINIGLLKIRYISTSEDNDIISIGYYQEVMGELVTVAEIVLVQAVNCSVCKNDPVKTYYPISCKIDAYGIDKTCLWFDEKNNADTFDRKEQKWIAKFVSKWIRNIEKE